MDEAQRQSKRVQQEAASKAALIHKSGMSFFCTILDEPCGDVERTVAALEVMNKPVRKPDGTVVRDLSAVGKLLLSANEDQLVVTAYVPVLIANTLNAWDWVDLIMNEHGGTLHSTSNTTVATGIIANEPEKDVYVFKLKDIIINNEYEFLRLKGALPPRQVESDDDMLLGDDAFDE